MRVPRLRDQSNPCHVRLERGDRQGVAIVTEGGMQL
jgi:hypothetical protein